MNVEIAGADARDVGRVTPRGGVEGMAANAGSGDPAYTGADAERHYAHR